MPKISLVPVVKSGSITADAIPSSVKKDLEELWEAYQKSEENHEIRVEFAHGFKVDADGEIKLDDEGAGILDPANPAEDVNLWLRQAVAYGKQRMNPDGSSAALKIRAMPKRNLPPWIKYISMARDIPADAAANTNKTSR